MAEFQTQTANVSTHWLKELGIVDEEAPDSLQVRWWPLPPGRWGISVQTVGGRELTEGLDLSFVTGIEEPTARVSFQDEDPDRVIREDNGEKIILESRSDRATKYVYEQVDGRYLMTDVQKVEQSTRQTIDRIRS